MADTSNIVSFNGEKIADWEEPRFSLIRHTIQIQMFYITSSIFSPISFKYSLISMAGTVPMDLR